MAPMNLDSILQDFDDIIIARGQAYFENGLVTSLEEKRPGAFTAIVEGTEDYQVTVVLQNDECADLSCDCPYSGNPYCKHVVAVLLAINEMKSQATSLASNARPKDARPAFNPLDTLDSLSKSGLLSLVREMAGELPDAYDWLRLRLAPAQDETKLYCKQIQKSLQTNSKRGYVEYARTSDALRGAETALSRLQVLINTAPWQRSLDFSVMLLEESMKCLECCDDSDGEVGYIIVSCLNCITELYDKCVSRDVEAQQTAFFQRILGVAASPLFSGWNEWNETLLTLCTRIADVFPVLRDSLLKLREEHIAVYIRAKKDSDSYALMVEQKAYFKMLQRWQGEEQAWQYALSNIGNPELRMYVINAFCQKKQYQEAVRLCIEGERQAGRLYGLKAQWKERRYQIYKKTGDMPAMRALGEELLLGGDDAYFEKLKELYPPEEWKCKRNELLDSLETGSGRQRAYLPILLRERDKTRILRYAQQNIDHPFHNIYSLYQYLLPDYQAEVRSMFYQRILNDAAHASDRKAYQAVCEGIGAYATACGKQLAEALIQKLKADYPRRPAFQDELLKSLSALHSGKQKQKANL